MILPISFLWQQLNGPQVKGISNAIFEYMKSVLDKKLDYFNNVSVDTVNSAHLTLLGLLSGLVRPTISEADRDYFYFSEIAEHNTTHGFSSLDNLTEGGRFSSLSEGEGRHNASLNDEYYRVLLQTWVAGDGEIGSLVLMDDLCEALTNLDLKGLVAPFYQFQFLLGPDVPAARSQGDIFIDVGNNTEWSNPLYVYAVLRGIADTAYAPIPQIFLSLGTQNQVDLPTASPEAGTYDSPQVVSLSCITPDAILYYTTDGSEPTDESTLYESPITISQTTTLKVRGYCTGYSRSDIATFEYIIE